MMLLHELGHILHALLTGGHITHLSLPLLGFSRTDISPNPYPQFVAWGGPLWGALLPLLLLLLTPRTLTRTRNAARLFAGFCLISNGAYLALGPLMTAGDAHDLLRHGAPAWTLVTSGLAALTAGLYLWHRATRPAPR
jgi:hypothetical protein